MSRIITITSGKGGVGKTSISLNLALSLAYRGLRICLFDADLGLANVNVLTGIYPSKDLESVMNGNERIQDIMIHDYHGVDIIPGSSGVEKIANLDKDQTARLINAFLNLGDYDFFIFDTSAGISSQVLSFCLSSREIVLVVTPEPTSLTDAYSMLKVLAHHQFRYPIRVLVNRAAKGGNAKKAYLQLKKTVARFIKIQLQPLGLIATDANVQRAVIDRVPFYLSQKNGLAGRCIQNITDKLIENNFVEDDIPLEKFWGRCLAFFNQHPSSGEQEPSELPSADKAGTFSEFSAVERLDAIEKVLLDLTGQVSDLKKICEKSSEKKEAVFLPSKIQTWSQTRRITQDPDAEGGRHKDKETVLWPGQNRSKKSIVRGTLRNPTPEELANWNESQNPVIRNPRQRSIFSK